MYSIFYANENFFRSEISVSCLMMGVAQRRTFQNWRKNLLKGWFEKWLHDWRSLVFQARHETNWKTVRMKGCWRCNPITAKWRSNARVVIIPEQCASHLLCYCCVTFFHGQKFNFRFESFNQLLTLGLRLYIILVRILIVKSNHKTKSWPDCREG